MKCLLRLLAAAVALLSCTPGACAGAKPNILYILADDLGYGDVGCLNLQGKIRTPQLDRLAAEGMVFTDAHSSSSVCTPSRYGLLTGRYNWRSRLKQGVLGGAEPASDRTGALNGSRILETEWLPHCVCGQVASGDGLAAQARDRPFRRWH